MIQAEKNSICTFTFAEKLYAQLTFNGGVAVAAYGLFLINSGLGIAYLLYAYVGILLLIRYTVCARCPHLNKANDCVQLPAPMMKKIIASPRSGALNRYEKILFVLVLYGTFILPLYWLASQPMVLILFIALFGGHLAGLRLHFCRNCQNTICIQNRNKNATVLQVDSSTPTARSGLTHPGRSS